MADAMSLRCPKGLRDEFSAKAQENGSNASSLIKEFMRQYIENPSILTSCINTSDTKNHLGQSILALQRRIDELEAEALDTEKLLNLLEGWSVPLLETEKAKAKSQPSNSSAENGISARQLAKRLGCDRKTLTRWKEKGNDYLTERTRERDPEGKAWVFDEQTTMYVEADGI